MKAWQYSRYGAPPEQLELADPLCPADGVIIEVKATGVCRSDWHAWQGHDPVPLPMVPGHEFAGTVVQIGADVQRWQVGARVTAPFVIGCGSCEFCRSGNAQVCPNQEQPGFTLPGSFADLVAIPRADANLVRLPDRVDFVAAASLGCRFATAFRALTGHARVQPGNWLAVHGCGGVGLSVVMIAKALGARVIAVDRSEKALELAAELGAELRLDPDREDVPAAIIEYTGGGVQVSLDAVGHPAVAAASVRSLRRRGRHVQIGLLLGDSALTPLPMDLLITRELEVYGSHGMSAADYPKLLKLVDSGVLDPSKLIHRVAAMSEAATALAAMSGPPTAGMTVLQG